MNGPMGQGSQSTTLRQVTQASLCLSLPSHKEGYKFPYLSTSYGHDTVGLNKYLWNEWIIIVAVILIFQIILYQGSHFKEQKVTPTWA